MSRNVFESYNDYDEPIVFTEEEQNALFEEALNRGVESFKNDVILRHAGLHDMPGLDAYIGADMEVDVLQHGVSDVEGSTFPEIGYPDYKQATGDMPWINNRSSWVQVVLNGVTKSPFPWVKNPMVDIRADEARAQGYLKGEFKKESFIKMRTRKTSPCTFYIKQHMDQEDIAYITNFSLVSILRKAMDIKHDEELARAILVGDGRDKFLANGDRNPDKIDEECIRPIISDSTDAYLITDTVETTFEVVDKVLTTKEHYMGSGDLTMFMSYTDYATLMTKRDEFGHRLYHTNNDLANEMGVKRIVDCPLFATGTFLAVDLGDYQVGNVTGMDRSRWDQFDLNFNKRLMLLESAKSGALVKPFSAIKITVDSD